jgi:uncharacterized protein YndB with AHSA1/START domain
MPTARASRTIAAPPDALWRIVRDPYHLPRWWPRVTRVEDVGEGTFTEVMKTKAGKTIRADFDLVRTDDRKCTVVWEQRVEGTPFAGVLSSSETEVRVCAAPSGREPAGSEVTIEMRQELSGRAPQAVTVGMGGSPRPVRGRMPSAGNWMLRRAAARMIGEALEGLERISA